MDQKMWNFDKCDALFDKCEKFVASCPPSNAPAKVKNWIFDVQFPGNWFEFDIIGNYF